jgi:predicted PurR-regulated permease PerM
MQDRTLKRIFILAGIALILWVLYLLKPVVLPFIGAFLVAYLFSPLVDKLHKIGLPRWLSISAVFIGIGVVITLAFWFCSTGVGTVDVCEEQHSFRYTLGEL